MKIVGFTSGYVIFLLYSLKIIETLLISILPTLIIDTILVIYCGVLANQLTNKSSSMGLLIETVFDLIFKIILIISIEKQLILSSSLCSGIFHLIFSMITIKVQSYSYGYPLLLIFNCFYYVIVLCIFLRVDKIVVWNMFACLW